MMLNLAPSRAKRSIRAMAHCENASPLAAT